MAKFPWMTLGDGTDVDQTSVSRQETTDIADGDQTTISRQETSNIEKAYARFTVQHKVAIGTSTQPFPSLLQTSRIDEAHEYC